MPKATPLVSGKVGANPRGLSCNQHTTSPVVCNSGNASTPGAIEVQREEPGENYAEHQIPPQGLGSRFGHVLEWGSRGSSIPRLSPVHHLHR